LLVVILYTWSIFNLVFSIPFTMAAPNGTPRIVELAAQISSSVAQLQEQLSTEGFPSPSFDENYSGKYPANVTELRDAVLDASAELHELLLDPLMVLFKFASVSIPAS
jgi:hypothetical protein